jgi:hypothetical protein
VPALNVLMGHDSPVGIRMLSLDEYADEIAESAAMNFVRWPIFNSPFWEVEIGIDFIENIEYIRTFFEGRMNYLAENWPQK